MQPKCRGGYYKCLSCNINFCSNCKIKHSKEHKFIEYDKINYICNEHFEVYVKYCKACNKNLCVQCENEHKSHETIYFGDILPNNKENEKQLKELKEYIDKLNNEINEIITKLKYISNSLEIYYKISSTFINRNDNNNRNYQVLTNINEFIQNNSIIIEDIKNIINNTLYNKSINLIDIYTKIKSIKDSNYITSEIDIKEEDINKEIRIINDNNYIILLPDNKSNEEYLEKYCEIKINDKIIPFSYFYKFKKKGRYMIKYSFTSYLRKIKFNDFEKIIKIDMSNLHTGEITDMSEMFSGCSSLEEINLSNCNTENVTNMSKMFSNCRSLKKINLSKINTEKVTDMSEMFSRCSSLKELNLSNFKTEYVNNMSGMFHFCEDLEELNLSNFKTENVTNMSHMFCGSGSLKELNLSKFSTKNVENMYHIFSYCNSLKKNKVITNDEGIFKAYDSCNFI